MAVPRVYMIDKECANALERVETATPMLILQPVVVHDICVGPYVGCCNATEQQGFLAAPLPQPEHAHTGLAPPTLGHLRGFTFRGPNP